MKLLIAIIHKDDSPAVLDALSTGGFPFTRLSTTGGFLRASNDTLLIGLEEENIEPVMDILRQFCSVRREFVDAQQSALLGGIFHAPVEVTVGGATVFVLDVEQFHQI